MIKIGNPKRTWDSLLLYRELSGQHVNGFTGKSYTKLVDLFKPKNKSHLSVLKGRFI